jgi:hypothetical protein
MIDALEVGVTAPEVPGQIVGAGHLHCLNNAFQRQGLEGHTISVSVVTINELVFVHLKRSHNSAIEARSNGNEHGSLRDFVLNRELCEHMLTPQLFEPQGTKHWAVRINKKA